MAKLTIKDKRIISVALATWGILLIGSGYTINILDKPVATKKSNLQIVQKRVAQKKTNEIKLKDIELEVNTPLSLNVKDYLDNSEEIDQDTIKSLKLDTSTINITQPGTYKYTISFKKKKYNGTCIIKEKDLPKLELSLKNLKLSKGSSLSTELATYINETLTDEVKNNIILDLSAVSTTEPGIYQYSVTYNNRLYTGTIEVYEPQTKIITPNNTEDKNNDKENEKEKEELEDNKENIPIENK